VGDLATALARVVLEAKAMVLDLEEAAVEGEALGGTFLSLEGKLGLGVGEDFLTVPGNGVQFIALGGGGGAGG
jgi:hypothetical protein